MRPAIGFCCVVAVKRQASPSVQCAEKEKSRLDLRADAIL
jgi:hypothetical protein